MSSSISAGLTSGTALAFSGDTSGALVLQTNGTTTAVTISTAQDATFAGKVTSAGALTLASNGTTTAVTIDTSQNVGIATSSPRVRLDVRSDAVIAAPTPLATAVASGVLAIGDTVGSVVGLQLNGSSYDTYIQSRNMGASSTAYNLLLQPLGGSLLVGTTSQLGAAKQTIFAGNTNATTYTTLGTTGGSSLYIQQQQTTSVTTSAVVILTPNLYGSLCLVHGSDGTNRFQDLIMCGLGTGTVNVITSLAIGGTPASRTYSQASSAYKVAMGSGTYTVQVSALTMTS